MIIITQYTKRILPEITFFNHVKTILPVLLQSLLMGGAVLVWMYIFENIYVELFGGVLVGAIVYMLTVLFFCKSEIKMARDLFRKH